MFGEITRKELDDIASEIALLHERLMRMGLYKTAKVAHNVTQAVGFEMAEIISGEHPTKLRKTV